MSTQAYTEAIDETYDSASYRLGLQRIESAIEVNDADSTHYGERIWIFCKNDEGAALVKGDVMELGDGNANGTTGLVPYTVVKSNTDAQAKHRVAGIVGHAVAAGKYFWLIAKGICEVTGDGSVAAGDRLVTKTGGVADTAVSNADATVDEYADAWGVALEADSGSPAYATSIIDCL